MNVTVSYFLPWKHATVDRRRKLLEHYGFDCVCPGCTQPAVGKQLDRLAELRTAIPVLMQRPTTMGEALTLGQELIVLMNVLQTSVANYPPAYFDLFQAAVLTNMRAQAMGFIELAAETSGRAGGEGDPAMAYYKDLAAQYSSFA